MDKIKAFFQNRIVKIVSYVLAGLGMTSLLVSGTGVADLGSFGETLAAIISLVSGLIAFVTERCRK